MEVQLEDGDPALLVAKAMGSYSLESLVAVFEKLAAAARRRGLRLILLDLSAIPQDIPDLDRYDMGKRGAEIFTHVDRLAVVRGTQHRYSGFAVDVAQNRGLDARGFLDRAEAAQWLRSHPD
jgi:hypothetical protein